MAGKQKPNNQIDDTPQLKPLGKSGKGKGLNKYLQSNAVKAGLAGVLVLLLVLIIAWQLMGGGSEPKSVGTTASSNTSQTAPSPPSIPTVPDTTTTTPEQSSTDQNGQPVQRTLKVR